MSQWCRNRDSIHIVSFEAKLSKQTRRENRIGYQGKCSFFGRFAVLRFLAIPALRFVLCDILKVTAIHAKQTVIMEEKDLYEDRPKCGWTLVRDFMLI